MSLLFWYFFSVCIIFFLSVFMLVYLSGTCTTNAKIYVIQKEDSKDVFTLRDGSSSFIVSDDKGTH